MVDQIVTSIPEQYDPVWMRDLLLEIQQRFDDLQTPAAGAYTVTNGSELRTIDVSAATLPDLLNFVATMVSDLQEKGQLE